MNKLSEFLVDSLLNEEYNIDKKIVVYAGRFQPFHKGHYYAYADLVKKFGKENVFIGTSNKTDNVKSPFNFKEKKEIMMKMFNIPSSQIVQIKNPYRPVEILSKFDEKTTAFITVVGKKDSNRLGGKYFTPYTSNELEPYREKGYVYIAKELPASSRISGTDVRNGLSIGSEEDRKDFFIKRVYGKFDQKIFDLLTSKLNESIHIPKEYIEEWLINEVTNILSGQADDGPSFMFPNNDVFQKVSIERANKIGYQISKHIMSDELQDFYEHPTYPTGPVQSVSFFPAGVIGKTTPTNQIDIYSRGAYSKWYTHATRRASLVGYSIVNSIASKLDKSQDSKSSGDMASVGMSMNEEIKLPVNVGDTILTGRFKNKKTVVKSIGKDEHGMPTINGKKVVTFRLYNESFTVSFYEDYIPGGLSDTLSIDDIAKKHKVPIDVIQKQIDKGTKIEMEHTDDEKIAREIAKDHVYELPDYYDRLETIETNEYINPIDKSMDTNGETILSLMDQKVIGEDMIWTFKFTSPRRYDTIKKLLSKSHTSQLSQDVDIKRKSDKLIIRFPKKDYWIVKGALVYSGVFGLTESVDNLSEMSKVQLNKIEKFADSQLAPDDVKFTRHFFDRVNDPRNKKEISDNELEIFFTKLSKYKDKFVDFINRYREIVVKDRSSKINIPFVRQANKVIAKTIMRKNNFRTSNPIVSFENVNESKAHMHGRNLGIPRNKMPQINSKDVSDFINFLKDLNIKVSPVKINVSKLNMTQKDINLDKVGQMMDIDIHRLEKPVIMSSDNFILDGHHRVLALYNVDNNHKMNVIKVHLSIRDLLEVTKDYPRVSYKNINEDTAIFNPDLGSKKKTWYMIGNDGALKILEGTLNELNTGIFRGKIKIDGKPVEVEVELFGSDNKNRYLTRVINIDKKYWNKLPADGVLPIPGKVFRHGGWVRVKTPSVFGESIITEGGAWGHMNHPFDLDINLTFGDLKRIIDNSLEGNLELAREKCISGDSIIHTENNGDMTISEFVDNKILDKVLSFNEETGQNEYMDVMASFNNDITNEWLEIELEDGKSIKVTPNHRIYVEGVGYVEAKDLTEDMELRIM